MNIPPNQTPRFLKRSAAANWLQRNDPTIKRKQFLAAKKRERELRQIKDNPGLVGSYRRAMLKS